MPEARTCPRCKEPLPEEGWEGLCPKCLVRVSLETPGDEILAPDSPDPVSSHPFPSETSASKGEGEGQATPRHAPVTDPSARAPGQAGETPQESVPAPEAGIVIEQTATRIGRYKLLQRIGEGGCGIVYMAEQEEPVHRRVALKIIKLGMDTREVIARFEAERQALALMDHPNIATIFDGGATDTGRPYLVMELVRGIRITDYCDQKRLSTRQRLDLFMQVCQAVQHAHQKGIIHRDLKPSNILVTVNDGVPVPKVIDFGIAKATGQRLTDKTLFTKLQQLIGTPAYMSPEQTEMMSVDIDTRSDLYSLGVLLYELLTARTPFDTKELLQAGVEEILRTIRDQEPVRPSKRLSTLAAADQTTAARQRQTEPPRLIRLLQGDLDWIVMKCLEKDRSRRYETANGLALDIQRHLNHEPVLAGPPTAAYRLRKLARKYRAAVSIAAAFLVLLTAATGVSLWLAAWANQERSNAVRAEIAAKEARGNAEQEALRANRERIHAWRAEATAKKALQEMQIQRAENLFAADDSTRAVAQLASVLTDDPSNRVAAEQLLSALTFRSFSLPLAAPLQLGSPVRFAQFSPDGLRLVTASADKTARVWDAQTGKQLTEPLRHEDHVWSAEFSWDGLRVVTASYDKTARVWDAQTGKPLTEPLRHEGTVNYAQFSPDGLRVVTASNDKTARVWDAQTGKPLTEPLRHEATVNYAQFSPDGLRVVTASDKSARVWDAQTGKLFAEPSRHEENVRSVQFSPDGLRVVTASDKAARVWDAQTGKQLTEPLRHEDHVWSAEFSPDGLRVVTASYDRTARLWDAQTGKQLTKPLRHEASVQTAHFSPDGLRVVTASADKASRVWDAQTGKPLTEVLRHEDNVWYAQFSSDGLRVLTASTSSSKTSAAGAQFSSDGLRVQNAKILVWVTMTGKALIEPLRHEDKVRTAQFSPDGLRVLTASNDKTARLWDAQTGKPLTEAMRHIDWVRSARFSRDGLRTVTASDDQTARVWDARNGKPITEPLRHEGRVFSAEFSSNGLHVVTASDDNTARLWDARSGKPLTEPLRHAGLVYSAHFSEDGLRVVTASMDKTARLWDAITGKPLTEPLRHEDNVWSAQFSPDGSRVLTASNDKTARLWDAQTGKPLAEPLRHEDNVWSAQFSPDGLRVVTASADKTARVWDAITGEPITEPFRHEGQVRTAQFSPDGLRVVTASIDGAIRVWDVQTGAPLSEPLVHEHSVHSAQFSPDGMRVVTASEDGTARIWDMPFGSTPVPTWLSQLAVSATGKSLIGNRVLDRGAAEIFLKLKEQLSMAPATNFYSRWAKWFLADRSTRTISPLSSITVPEYVHRPCARLSQKLLPQDSVRNPREAAEAHWCSQRALQLATNDAEVWLTRAEFLEQSRQLDEALKAILRSIDLNPNDPATWNVNGELLQKANRLDEANVAYSKAIDLANTGSRPFKEIRVRALLSRSKARKQLNRLEEARADFLQAKGIPVRNPQAKSNLLDLSRHYNVGLGETWHPGHPRNNLGQLPSGVRALADVQFDIRGLIQVGSESFDGLLYPEGITNIAVHQLCRRLHFLHSAILATTVPSGKEIGRYTVHYANGESHPIAIIIGRDVADWFSSTNENISALTVAWVGDTEESRATGRKIRLFKTTWENPQPAIVIESIDFVAGSVAAKPFLVAITVE